MQFVYSIKRLFTSYQGRHYMSRWARVWFRTTDHVRRVIGVYLATAVFAVGVGVPNAHDYVTRALVAEIPANPYTVDTDVTTETSLAWPVHNPRLTQGYRHGHAGIDLQDTQSLNIYPIDKGWVAHVEYSRLGYGNHVYVHHPYGRTSLYAHFDSIAVAVGDTVTRETVLGQMGSTGWSTGTHLHLEIFQNGVTVDPLQVLPARDDLQVLFVH